MKTSTFWIVFCLIIFSEGIINAQKFKFGLLVGLDIANAHLTDKPDIEGDLRMYYPMIAFNANGFIEFKSTGFVGFSTEPGFIQKGGLQKYDKDNKDDDVRIQLNYIQIPILVDLYMSNKLFLSIGPELAYMINARAKSKDNSYDISNLYDNEFEISGLIGINYNIIEKIDVGLRYSHGLSYTMKILWRSGFGDYVGESKDYNQYFQLIVKFRI